MFFISYGTKTKPSISNFNLKQSKYNHLYVLSSTLIESVTSLIIKDSHKNVPWILFLPMLFLFELFLDFFHYTFHRMLHSKYLYFIHKTHHYYQNPRIINTYYHNPLDLIITISIPTLISLYMLYYTFTSYQIQLVMVYKSFIEISGHSGKYKLSSSFPLCIWIPRILGIELYTEDHHLHHSQNNCNYSKRFSIWDKLFGTYCKLN